MTSLYEAAMEYNRAGMGVLALQGKVPHPRHNPHGFKTPLDGYGAIERACADPSTTGIGLVCTPTLWVLDIDGPDGWEALHAKGIFPLTVPTAVAVTARGAHFWFESPESPQISRAQGSRFLPGVDLKASGYVVAPPSMHPSGVAYYWSGASLVSNGFWYAADAADAPAPLMEFLDELAFAERALGPSPYLTLSRRDLSPLASHLRRADAGERNGTLNWCALRAGASGATLEEALDVLLPVALSIGLTPKESRATIKSGWLAGSKEAR